MIRKYGKSVQDIISIKQMFFDDNDMLVNQNNKYAEFYKKQPIRKKCKMCNFDLSTGTHYESHDIEYIICKNCGHVCGNHEETNEYIEYLYNKSDYGEYTYSSETKEKYDHRLNKIYLPKAQFLLEVLDNEKIDKLDISLLDIGAGSGYFVSACDDIGIVASGVDMSESQVNLSQPFIHKNIGEGVKLIKSDELQQYIKETKCNVVSAIGVLEHLIDFHQILNVIVCNENISYLYISVPMFGLSNLLETLLPDIFNRHLGGTHTHVFSQQSINYMCDMHNMDIIGIWQFGTDMMDLYRMCAVKNKDKLNNIMYQKFLNCLDDMQLILDKNNFCSEAHIVFKIKR